MFVVKPVDYFFFENFLQLLHVKQKTGSAIHNSAYGDFKLIIMAMTIGIAAFAIDFPVVIL